MIVDANVLVSALIGRSFADLRRWSDAGIELKVPEAQMRETAQVLRYRIGRSADEVARLMASLEPLSTVVESHVYDRQKDAARSRLGGHVQPDWPVLAAAIALDEPILSNDRDFFGVGVTVWSTAVFKREMESPNG